MSLHSADTASVKHEHLLPALPLRCLRGAFCVAAVALTCCVGAAVVGRLAVAVLNAHQEPAQASAPGKGGVKAGVAASRQG